MNKKTMGKWRKKTIHDFCLTMLSVYRFHFVKGKIYPFCTIFNVRNLLNTHYSLSHTHSRSLSLSMSFFLFFALSLSHSSPTNFHCVFISLLYSFRLRDNNWYKKKKRCTDLIGLSWIHMNNNKHSNKKNGVFIYFVGWDRPLGYFKL